MVKGNSRGCIYDFNSSKLYSVNDMLTREIDLVNSGEVEVNSVNEELAMVFEELIEKGILVLSETPIKRQIDEIKLEKTEISFAWIEITNKYNSNFAHKF